MSEKAEVQILRELCEGRMLQDQIKRHNDKSGKLNHIQPNKMMVTVRSSPMVLFIGV